MYFKYVLTTCIAIWITTLVLIAVPILGLTGVLHMNMGFWFISIAALIVMLFCSVVFGFILSEEIAERRKERDNRKRLAQIRGS